MAIPSLDEIFDEFLDLDPVDQNKYLMELGYDLPPFPDESRTEANRVHGCQSQVWLIMNSSGAESDAKFTIVADSDANIIKGLLAILQAAYNGMTASQIAEFDILSVFKKLDLEHHITPQRRNGLRGMVERILTLANRHRLVSEGGSADTELPSSAANGCGLSSSSKPDANARRADALPLAETPAKPFDAAAIRAQFPVLNRSLPSGRQAVFLDSGASAQKPSVVIEKEREVEEQYFANAHRGTYQFGLRIDEEFEGARDAVARFLKAPSSNQIVFTPGTTIGLNMIASGWGRKFVQPGDEILTTVMEHHANFVPWQQLTKERGATLKLIPLTDDGQLDLSRLDDVLTRRTKVVAVTGMSNMLGTINPIRELAKRAHDVGACIVVDGAQSVPHHATDVMADDVDFLVFSGHKVYGPTGVGILYGKPERLDEMDPIIFGGHMIHQVHVSESTWSAAPAKFEAGTMPIVQAIALGTAIRWVEEIGIDAIHQHEQSLLKLAWDKLSTIPGMKVFGPSLEHRGGILSFRIDGLHPEDLAAILDQRDVFTRHGHHCTMPLHTHLGVSATTRVSFGAYNTTEDVERLVEAIEYARSIVR